MGEKGLTAETDARGPRRYNPLSLYLRERYGCRVFKVPIDAGLTCPNRDGTKGTQGCVYCEPAVLLPEHFAYAAGGDASIEAQLKTGCTKVARRHSRARFIAYFQHHTNTYAPVDYLKDIYTRALAYPGVVGLAVSTRPDCVDDSVLDLLSRLRAEKGVWLELGLQSANDKTLESMNRCHTAADFTETVARARVRGIDVCAHVILGLPGEDADDMVRTMRFLADAGTWGVKFHQLQVIKGTRLEELYNEGNVGLLTLEEYARLVVECLEELPPDVVIHRLSADTPSSWLAGGAWKANKFEIKATIEGLMLKNGAFQGRARGAR